MDGPHCFNRSQHFFVDLSSIIRAALSHHFARFIVKTRLLSPNMILLGSTRTNSTSEQFAVMPRMVLVVIPSALATTIGSVGLPAPSALRLPSNNMSAVVLRRTKVGLAQPSGRGSRQTPGAA